MPECVICKGYTKYRNGYCSKCYHSEKNRLQTTKNAPEYNRNGFPSHTDLYRDFHKIERDVLEFIFDEMGWTLSETRGLLFKKEVGTEYNFQIESNGWDLVYNIQSTPEEKLEISLISSDSKKYYYHLGLEYKSSINEWGKQIDAFFRQIKSRNKDGLFVPILISFDPAFEEYVHACEGAGIILIVLPQEILNKLRS